MAAVFLLVLMKELQIAPEYANRYMNVGFSDGEKKRNEILQLLTLKPKLALLDETDSGLDVDAVEIVSSGVAKFHNENNSCIIITHNAQILKHLPVNRAHIFLNGRIVKSVGAATYRSAVKVTKNAPFAKYSVNCESLMLDDESRSDTSPDVYTEPITAVANVVERADTNHLSIIVTDLFESEADWSNVAQKLREKFFANHLAVAVVGIRNSFNGEIFDVGLNAAKFNYNSFDDPNRFRPFYLLVMGRDDVVKNFLRKFNEKQTLPNDTGYLLLSENLTETPANFSNFKLGEVENFYSDNTLGLDARVKEFGADNFNEAASFMFSWKYEPPLGACPLDLSEVDTSVEIFSVDGEEWTPREKNDVRVNLLKDERQSEFFLVKVSLTPEKSLAEGKLNFVRIKIMPKEQGYRLPAWTELWSVNVDGAAKIFDGSKTLNLTRILGSLKDSVFAASRPALLQINFVVTP